MYSLPFVSVITAPSPDSITTSLSAMTCMSAKPCQNRVGMARRLHVVTERGMPSVDRPRVKGPRELLARRHRREACGLAEQAHLPYGSLPGEIRPGTGR